MNAQPGPMVSGSHFLPKAPLLCAKRMPDWAVMSANVMICADAKLAATISKDNTQHEDTRISGRPRLIKPPMPHSGGICSSASPPLPSPTLAAAARTRVREYFAVHYCLQD